MRRRTDSAVRCTEATVGDAQALVEIGARGIVDAGHHVFDVKTSRATRAAIMFELSPEDTAAKAYASLMLA